MNKRILMYKGQIPELDVFSNELAIGLMQKEAEIFFYDVKENNILELSRFCDTKVDAVVTFNTMFYNMLIGEGVNAWKQMNIPYITILVDHPRNFANTLALFDKKDKVFCIDREHCAYVSRFFPNIGFVGSLPHGGTATNIAMPKPFGERKIDVLYAGSIPVDSVDVINIPEEVIQKYEGWFDVRKVVKDLYQLALVNYEANIECVIEVYMNNILRGQLNENILKALTIDFGFLHNYILSYYRLAALHAASESNAQIYIYGENYHKYKFTGKENVHMMGMVAPDEILKLMTDSKIVLSTMAWFKDGAHERIFNGMLSGAVVLSEERKYLTEALNCREGKEQEIYTFSLGNLEQIPKIINRILEDEVHAAEVTKNAIKAGANHTWKKRAKRLYDTIWI